MFLNGRLTETYSLHQLVVKKFSLPFPLCSVTLTVNPPMNARGVYLIL